MIIHWLEVIVSWILRIFKIRRWCPGPDSNRHGILFRGILSPLCLPISPPGRRRYFSISWWEVLLGQTSFPPFLKVFLSVLAAPGKSLRPKSERNVSEAAFVESSSGIPLESAVLTRPLKIAAMDAASMNAALLSFDRSFSLACSRLSEPIDKASPNSTSSAPAGISSVSYTHLTLPTKA